MRLHPHAIARMQERGATEAEVEATIRDRERFAAKFGRQGFRRNLNFDENWRGQHYATKQIEAITIYEDGDWLVISVIVKYF